MEPHFKRASTLDLPVLTQLINELYAHEQISFDEQAAVLALKSLLNNPDFGQIFLIEINGEIVGYLVITFSFSLEYHGRDALIDELYIRSNFRQQGIGKKSLKFVEQICQEKGIKVLHLEVERQNTKAQALYHQAGFVDHDRYLLTKKL